MRSPDVARPMLLADYQTLASLLGMEYVGVDGNREAIPATIWFSTSIRLVPRPKNTSSVSGVVPQHSMASSNALSDMYEEAASYYHRLSSLV